MTSLYKKAKKRPKIQAFLQEKATELYPESCLPRWVDKTLFYKDLRKSIFKEILGEVKDKNTTMNLYQQICFLVPPAWRDVLTDYADEELKIPDDVIDEVNLLLQEEDLEAPIEESTEPPGGSQPPKIPPLTIYTDGSCSGKTGGWGAIALCPQEVTISGHDPNTTNNRMELTAVIEALKRFPDRKAFLVYSDSQLTINCAQKLWKRNKNLDLWEEYDRIAKNKTIKFEWVKAHNGDYYNEKVNTLANDARLKRFST